MEIRKELLEELSKEQTIVLRDYIGTHAGRLADLMRFFCAGDERANQRAGWVASHLADVYPEVFVPYQNKLVKMISHPGHAGIRRNALRILCRLDLPENLWGEAYDRSMRQLTDPKVPVGVKRFAMEVAWNICKKVPDLGEELRLVIEDGMEHGSAGYRNYGNKVLKGLAKKR